MARTHQLEPRSSQNQEGSAKIDISQVKNPLAEYQELGHTPYFPIDRALAKRLQITNKYPESSVNPHLDQVLNSNLPFNLYDEHDLSAMCSEEGYQI